MGSRLYGLIVTQNNPEYVWNEDGTNADLNTIISVSFVTDVAIWKQMNCKQDLDSLQSSIDMWFSIPNRKRIVQG